MLSIPIPSGSLKRGSVESCYLCGYPPRQLLTKSLAASPLQPSSSSQAVLPESRHGFPGDSDANKRKRARLPRAASDKARVRQMHSDVCDTDEDEDEDYQHSGGRGRGRGRTRTTTQDEDEDSGGRLRTRTTQDDSGRGRLRRTRTQEDEDEDYQHSDSDSDFVTRPSTSRHSSKQASTSARGKSPQRVLQEKRQCPICSEYFDTNTISSHASTCSVRHLPLQLP